MAEADGRRPWLLAIDTATSRVVVAAGDLEGNLHGAMTTEAGHRHGERLLPMIGRLTGELNLRRSRIEAVVVGTGPGAFTGLRVGIATAKGLAHALRKPIIGVSTGEALIEAARGTGRGPIALLVPAGPSDRVLVRAAVAPVHLPGGSEPQIGPDETLVAVDLVDRAPDDAVARGSEALDRQAAALRRIGARRRAAEELDDLARLVPEYVTLPRGVTTSSGEVAWLRDPR